MRITDVVESRRWVNLETGPLKRRAGRGVAQTGLWV